MARRLMLAMAAASCVGVGAFLQPSAQPMTELALRASMKQSAFAQSGSAESRGDSATRVSVIFAGLLAAAACRRQPRIARRISLSDINNLKVKDLPDHFRPKVSMGQSRRFATVKGISTQLDKTFFLMAWNRERMLGRDVEAGRELALQCCYNEEARAMFPETCKVRVLKNSLVKKAMEGTEWEAMSPLLKGSNVYVFVESDTDLKPAIQAYIKLEKRFDRTAVIDGIKEVMDDDLTYELKSLVGGVMSEEWNVLDGGEVLKLKDFPTKTELIGQIAGSIKQVTQKLAVGIKQVPNKLAIGIKKTVEKGEEGGKGTVGDVA